MKVNKRERWGARGENEISNVIKDIMRLKMKTGPTDRQNFRNDLTRNN